MTTKKKSAAGRSTAARRAPATGARGGGTGMKLIVAIVQPHRLDAVREALSELGVQGMTVTEVRGFGRQKGHTEIYRGAEYTVHYVPKVKIEIALDARMAERGIETIRDAARTGHIGDGKIFVFGIEQAIRVRTGETGPDAL